MKHYKYSHYFVLSLPASYWEVCGSHHEFVMMSLISSIRSLAVLDWLLSQELWKSWVTCSSLCSSDILLFHLKQRHLYIPCSFFKTIFEIVWSSQSLVSFLAGISLNVNLLYSNIVRWCIVYDSDSTNIRVLL
jgi:hypothetical protein